MSASLDRLLLDYAGEILLLVDGHSLTICAANARAEEALGYSRDALIGKPVTDIECALSDVFFWEEVRHGGPGELLNAEGVYQTAQGEMLTVSKSIARVPQSQYLAIRAHNVAAEKQAEEALAYMASQLRATLEATVDGILVVDRSRRIVNMNRRFAQMWRAPDELLLRHEDQRLGHFIEAQLCDPSQYAQVVAKTGPDSDAESFDTVRLVDGRVFECKSRPARHAEQIIGRVFCFTDVTEHYQAEAALTAARDTADAASRAKSEFLAMMSHEIRTPMNGVIGMAQLLEGTELSAEQREFVHTMRTSGEALVAIINDILDYSKIEARKLRIERTPFELSGLVGDLERLFALSAKAKNLRFTCRLSPDIPNRLSGDPTRVRQILVNLIGNALKFTDHGGVDLTVSRMAAGDGGVRVHFAVRDTGVGIAPERLERIFSPFEQADVTTTRRFGGTGLGLSICRMLCELMGGQIGVRSQSGQGSEFWFEVPFEVLLEAEPLRAVQPVKKDPGVAVTEQTQLLVVEDNPVNVVVISNLLKKLGGRQITVARDGEQALQACAKTRYDIIFMDTHMPVLDGLGATRALRERGETSHIIGVSADAMAEDRQAALDSGMDDYVAKPVSLEALQQSLQRWSNRQTSA